MSTINPAASFGEVKFGAIEEYLNGSGATQRSAASENPLASKDIFLKLLVAQVKNQDPMNPADGTQYVAQLAQFSSLEQMLDIRKELESIRELVAQMQPQTGEGNATP